MDQTRTVPVKSSTVAYVFLGSFLVSVLALQWWQKTSYPLELWIILGILGLFGTVGILLKKGVIASIILAATIAISLALFTVSRTTHIPSQTTIDTYATGKTATIHGIIADAPDDRQIFIRYTVDATDVQLFATGAVIPVTGKILVTDRRHWPRYRYGDSVMIKGIVDLPKNSETFAYDNYLSRFGIYTTMRASVIEQISEGHKNPVMAGLIRLREAFEAQINRVFPEPQASFLAGLLTGSRRGMPDHLTDAFKATGLSHIVAISGFNITIIITIISGALFFLPLKWRFMPAVVTIILFTLFVGASASVARASIMGILGLFALQTGRLKNIRLLIAWTAFFMLLWNPKLLWYDAGFQLSFLAVIGLSETAPILERWLKRIPNVLGVREALTVTIAAQVFAMPWVVLQFGTLSLISPLANILVAPLIPFAMLCGFLGTVISIVSLPVGQLTGFVAWGCMELILLIATTLARIPFASLTLPKIGVAIVGLYYVLIITGLITLHGRTIRSYLSSVIKILRV
ncbi:ComEC family competence protein [Candidatus Peribacteria bacterium]|nr:MAG: ComEC family competence protein [Candidatus Peribacteria bacterium]